MSQKVYHKHFSVVYTMKLSSNTYLGNVLKEIFHSVSSPFDHLLATVLKVTLLHGCFSRLLKCTHDIKSRKASVDHNLPQRSSQITRNHLKWRAL